MEAAAMDKVEAQSLSAINYLAANPPQYPVNPTVQARESLVLYISRVPGSRDVILSPFKPRRKNVTGDDVNNSLYYVHLDGPSDRSHRPVHEPQGPSGAESHVIHRKPLPSSAKLPQPSGHVGPLPGAENLLPVQQDGPFYSASEGSAPSLPPRPAQESQASPPPILRKPLGPRQMTPSRPAPAGSQNHEQIPNPSPLQARPLVSEPEQIASGQESWGNPPDLPPRPPKRHQTPLTPFSLSLIRRDPSSGQQWNVGKISSLQAEMATLDDSDADRAAAENHRPHRAGHPTIRIRIDTSGYAKFRGIPTGKMPEAARPGSPASVPQSFSALYAASANSSDDYNVGAPRALEQGFVRQVAMSYGKSWTSNIRDAFKRHSHSRSTEAGVYDNAAVGSPPSPPFARHNRQDSGTSTGSADSAWSTGEQPTAAGLDTVAAITRPGPGFSARGYVFASPWGSQCEFRTGSGGRTLACQHVPAPGNVSSNPVGTTAQGRRKRHDSLSKALGIIEDAPVSELRFNLPSADLFKDTGSQGDSRTLHARLDSMLKLSPRHRIEDDSSDPFDDDENSTWHLNLGREKAGGGNRGKRAKLGKLIIYDEGQKMLDLVVAANLGIWWGAWERSA